MKRPKVSVIIPVYNASDFLRRTVECVLSQSYDDFELILVNDGSTDSSGSICDDIALYDTRVRVIHQSNSGVSCARNAGLETACGEWVAFVDSDDLLLDCFLSSLIDAVASNNSVDLAFCGFIKCEGFSADLITYQSKVYIGKDVIRGLLSTSNLLNRCSSWAKLYRRSIIESNHLRFDEKLHHSEDRLFVYNYLLWVGGIAVTSQPGYVYGSFSLNSLKSRHNPINILAYRQAKIGEAAHLLIDKFELDNDGDAFLISRNLTLLLLDLMKGIYYECGLSRKTNNLQNEYFNTYFDSGLYQRHLKGNLRWEKQLSGDVLIKYMLEKKFSRLNRTLYWRELDMKLRYFTYYKLLKRKNKGSFNNNIEILN